MMEYQEVSQSATENDQSKQVDESLHQSAGGDREDAEIVPADPPGRFTPVLMLSIFGACIGNAFVFGWHIAVTNQPFQHIQDFFNKTYYERNGGDFENDDPIDESKLMSEETITLLLSLMVAIWVFFGLIGSFAAEKVANKLGRKKGMLVITSIVITSGFLGYFCKTAKSPELLILCRLMAGVHTGLCINLNTMYLSEISPVKYRGSIGTLFQLTITIGILCAQVAGLPELLGTKDLWPVLFLLSIFPALTCAAILPFCPESPSYLLLNAGKEAEAIQALKKLRATDQVNQEIAAIREEAAASAGVENYSIVQLLLDQSIRRNVIIACLLMVSQQWSGINAVMTYSTLMFKLVKIEESMIPYMVVLTGTVNVLMTIVVVPLMEKAGRRRLLLYPTALAFASFIILTGAQLAEQHIDDDSTKTALGGLCITMVMTYITGFACGLGPVPFVLTCEIFRQEPRAAAMSLAMVCNWGANFILMLLFPLLSHALGPYVNLFFVVLLFFAIIFFWKYIPETKGKTIEEIDLLIKGKKIDSQTM